MALLGGLDLFWLLRVRALAAAATALAVVVVAVAAAAPRPAAAAGLPAGPVPFPARPSVACGAPRVRKEVGALSAAEWATYQRAVTGLHARETSARRSTLDWFERFVDLHATHARAAHNGAHFLAWHRLFLLAYENALRTVEPGVTIPYWDWSMDAADPAMAPVWATHQLGRAADGGRIGAGEPAAGHNFNELFVDTDGPHHVTRGFISDRRGGLDANAFADKPTMRALWRDRRMSFTDFVAALEYAHSGPHVAIGGLAGGDMFLLNRAAGDVAFFSHHAYIDFVWAMRQQAVSVMAYGGTTGDGTPARLDDVLAPFGVTARTAVALTCVTYVADPRRTRAAPLRTATPTAPLRTATPTAPLRTATPTAPLRTVTPTAPLQTVTPTAPLRTVTPTAPLRTVTPTAPPAACTRSDQCGCGVCRMGRCRPGWTRRTRAYCGERACVAHGGARALMCRCTRDAQCGCGACDTASGACTAPSEARRAAHCGRHGQCVVARRRRQRRRRLLSPPAYVCTQGPRCLSRTACGCGVCLRRRCAAHAWRTRRACGSHAACVVAGASMVCRAERASARLAVAAAVPAAAAVAVPAAAAAAVPAAVRPVVPAGGTASAADAPLAGDARAALAALRARMAAARAEAAAVLAAAEADERRAVAAADAEVVAVDKAEAAIKGAASRAGAAAAPPSGRLAALLRAAGAVRMRSSAAAAKADAARQLAALERNRAAAEASRRAAVAALRARRKGVKRRLRVTAFAGFASVNGMDARRFTRGEAPLERAEDAAEAEEDAAAAAARVAALAARRQTGDGA